MNLTKIIGEEYAQAEEIKIAKAQTVPFDERMIKVYEEFLKLAAQNAVKHHLRIARRIIQTAKINYSSEHITILCGYLSKYEEDNSFESTGDFLSELINIHYEQTQYSGKYIIFLKDIQTEIENLGSENNGADILVIGNVGDHLASKMFAGKITVEGNAKSSVGYEMRGGTVSVKNAKNLVGSHMKNGKLYLKEAEEISDKFIGGEIHISQGTVFIPYSFDSTCTGKIFLLEKDIMSEIKEKQHEKENHLFAGKIYSVEECKET